MTATYTDAEHIFDTASDLRHQHTQYLESVPGAPTVGVLEPIDVQPVRRCLDLGAGGGPITRWLAEGADPTRTVVAVDLDTDHLPEQPGVVAAPAPGGWIVIGEPSGRRLTALAAPAPEDFDLWSRIERPSNDVIGPVVGMDRRWACEVVHRTADTGW